MHFVEKRASSPQRLLQSKNVNEFESNSLTKIGMEEKNKP